MKRRHLLSGLLVLFGLGLIAVQYAEKPSKTADGARTTDNSSPKAERNNRIATPHSATVQAALERVTNRKSPESKRAWMPADTAKFRKLKFQGIIDDELKSVDLSGGGEERLLADFLLIDDLRNELEAPMVQVVSFNGGVLRLQIPADPETGNEVRELLQAMLARDFSADVAATIMKKAEPALMYEYHGLGTMNQTFTVTSSDRDGADVRVDWRLELAQIPDKETLIAKRGVWGGSTGTVEYPLSSFDSGPYAFLGPTLRKYFGAAEKPGAS